MEQRYHPILDHPWEYSITEVHWGMSEDGYSSTYLDLHFVKNNHTRKLRFIDPQQVQINLDGKYSQGCGEMVILDIRERGWEGLNVEVAEGGASGSPITLYAREIVDIT